MNALISNFHQQSTTGSLHFAPLQVSGCVGESALPAWWNALPTRSADLRPPPPPPASPAEGDLPRGPSSGHNSYSKKDSLKNSSSTSMRTIGERLPKCAPGGETYFTPLLGGGTAWLGSWTVESLDLPPVAAFKGSTTL